MTHPKLAKARARLDVAKNTLANAERAVANAREMVRQAERHHQEVLDELAGQDTLFDEKE